MSSMTSLDATPETFRALARSSPWRWTTLRFTFQQQPARGPTAAGVRAWLRRPKLLRVEDLDGGLVTVVHERGASVMRVGAQSGGGPVHLSPPHEIAPTLRADGLVDSRPSRWEVDYDAPMLDTYYWVALLDPVELADGHDGGAGAVVEDVRLVDHHGRPAWEASLTPAASYDPRCSCCPLLHSAEADRLEAEGRGATAPIRDPDVAYPDDHRVRLDVGTGVCVALEQRGGSRDGWRHEVVIEAVDEPTPDELFDGATVR